MIDLTKFSRKKLIELIKTLGFDSKFGMFQRDYAIRAIDGKSGVVMFLDLDDFKGLNTRLGYQGADKLVNEAFSVFTTKPDYYTVFRWFSGDEIVIFSETDIITEDINAAQSKLGFTGAVGRVNGDLVDKVNKLSIKVMRLKKTGQKGVILREVEDE